MCVCLEAGFSEGRTGPLRRPEVDQPRPRPLRQTRSSRATPASTWLTGTCTSVRWSQATRILVKHPGGATPASVLPLQRHRRRRRKTVLSKHTDRFTLAQRPRPHAALRRLQSRRPRQPRRLRRGRQAPLRLRQPLGRHHRHAPRAPPLRRTPAALSPATPLTPTVLSPPSPSSTSWSQESSLPQRPPGKTSTPVDRRRERRPQAPEVRAEDPRPAQVRAPHALPRAHRRPPATSPSSSATPTGRQTNKRVPHISHHEMWVSRESRGRRRRKTTDYTHPNALHPTARVDRKNSEPSATLSWPSPPRIYSTKNGHEIIWGRRPCRRAHPSALPRGSTSSKSTTASSSPARLRPSSSCGKQISGSYDLCATLSTTTGRYKLLTLPVRARRKLMLSRDDRATSLIHGRHHTDEYARILLAPPRRPRPPSNSRPSPRPRSPQARCRARQRSASCSLPPARAICCATTPCAAGSLESYVTLAEALLARGYEVVLAGGPDRHLGVRCLCAARDH